MKRFLSVIVTLALVTPVLAQDGNDGAASGRNTLDELWNFQDAVPLDAGSVDLRFSFGWDSGGVSDGSGDNFILTPSLYWGIGDNYEFSVGLPIWLFDGGDRGAFDEGNSDTNLGVLWRFAEQDDGGAYDVALAGNFRLPTGDHSNGVDYELRLAMTHVYDSGVRSHFNLFGEVVNGDNNDFEYDKMFVFGGGEGGDDERNFQYGVVIGVDYPLCDDGAVRLIIDYMHRSSVFEGQNNWNMAEIGWEWDMSDSDRFGMSFQFNLDRSNDAANVGAIMTYAHALTY